jgi:hypothetical protein
VDGRDAAPGRGACLQQVAVVVPLDEVDRVLAEDRVHRGQDVGEGVGVREVEHQLVALQQR